MLGHSTVSRKETMLAGGVDSLVVEMDEGVALIDKLSGGPLPSKEIGRP